MADAPSELGLAIALGVGVTALAGAVVVGVVLGSGFGGLILALVGASALSGWIKARSRR